jgi:hypothetical protein
MTFASATLTGRGGNPNLISYSICCFDTSLTYVAYQQDSLMNNMYVAWEGKTDMKGKIKFRVPIVKKGWIDVVPFCVNCDDPYYMYTSQCIKDKLK